MQSLTGNASHSKDTLKDRTISLRTAIVTPLLMQQAGDYL